MCQAKAKYFQSDEYSLMLDVAYTSDSSVYTILFDSIFYDGGIVVKKHFQKGSFRYSVHPFSTKSVNPFQEKGVAIQLKNGTSMINDTVSARYFENKFTPGYAKIAQVDVTEEEFRLFCENEVEWIRVGAEVVYFDKWQRKLMINIFRNIWNRDSAKPYFQPRNQ